MTEFEARKQGFIKRLPKNTVGRDFFTGDVHGCFTLLNCGLQMVDFDFNKDRLIAVGDLVDRGKESHLVLEWLAKPWFHSVMGNHEDMAIWCALGGRERDLDLKSYVTHGGGWFAGMTAAEKQEYAYCFTTMPYLIEVETEVGLVGVVHADTLNDDWAWTVSRFEQVQDDRGLERLKGHVLWSRNRFNQMDNTPVSGVEAVIVGHTPVPPRPVALGNTYFIDTGAVFRNGTMTLLEVGDLKNIPQIAPNQH